MTIYTTTVVTIAMLFLGLAHASDNRNWEVGLTPTQVDTITKLFNEELSEYQASRLRGKLLKASVCGKLKKHQESPEFWQAVITFGSQILEIQDLSNRKKILTAVIEVATTLRDDHPS